ncbi:inner membrane-spanning protein YciB [Brevundimonas sp.]|uniref:inner membrane-spanning protein YciB n=1 Tax=Brevundimonas sp. TaxID=1871086 RepID=UPI0035159577
MSEHASPPAWVRQAVDFGALVAFAGAFLFYRLNGLEGDEALVQATWFLVGGAAIAVVVGLVVERRLALMPLIVGGFALVFGLLTLLTQDDLWVKLKVTILNVSLSILLLGGLKMGKQPLKALLGTVIPINDRAWKILTLRYGLFFAAVALVNEAVRSEALVGWATAQLGYDSVDPADVWVSFRGVLWIASSVFGLSNMPLIFRNLQSEGGDETAVPPPGPNAAP